MKAKLGSVNMAISLPMPCLHKCVTKRAAASNIELNCLASKEYMVLISPV